MNYKIGLYGEDTQTDLILVNPAGDICARRTTIGVNPDLMLDQDTIRSVLLEKLEELAAHAKAEDTNATIAHTALCLPGSLSFWEGIVACGLENQNQISLAQLLDEAPDMELVIDKIIKSFEDVFDYELSHSNKIMAS